MKRIFFLSEIIAGLMFSFIFFSCGDGSKKHIEDAKKNVKEVAKNLDSAAIDVNEEVKSKTISEWKTFKKESDIAISTAENQAKELKGKINKTSGKQKEKLEIEVNKLESESNEQKQKLLQRNAEFEAELKKLNASIVSKNESFKQEFKHDMNRLDSALKGFFKDNVNK